MHVLSIDEKIKICEECPIYSPARAICNPKLYLNPDNNDVRTTPKNGYIKGCGCAIKIKARNPHNHCIAGKW